MTPAEFELASSLAQALRSVPCRCGADSIDRPMDKRTPIECGRCKRLKEWQRYVDGLVIVASHAGAD